MFGIVEHIIFPERPGRLLSGIVLAYAAVIASVLVAFPVRSAPPRPYHQIIAKDAVLYAPDGRRFSVPAGTVLEMCVDTEPPPGETPGYFHYVLDADAFVVPEPCAERPLFEDGFES